MSKRTLEPDLEAPRERYVFIAVYLDDAVDNPVTRTTLSFTDLALGAKLFDILLALRDSGKEDLIDIIFHYLASSTEERATFKKIKKLDEKTRQLLDSVGSECVENTKEADDAPFGLVKNGFYYHQEW